MRKFNSGTSLRICLLAALVVGYQNCSKGTHDSASEGALSSQASCEPALLEVFKSDFHPLMTQQCASCHVAGGAGKSKFAESDFDLAWNQFRNMGNSGPQKVYTNGTNIGHSGNANLTGPVNDSVLKPALDKFNLSLMSCKSGASGFLTKSKVLKSLKPAVINNNVIGIQSETIFAWNLNSEMDTISGLDYGEAYFIVSVTKTSDDKNYIVYNPRIRTYEREISLADLSVYINGSKIGTTSTFAEIEKVIPPYTSEYSSAGSLSGLASYIPFTVSSTDYLQFSFSKLGAK